MIVTGRPTLRDLLELLVARGASDLHLVAGAPPSLRIHGALEPAHEEPLSAAETRRLTYSILSETLRARFEEARQLDFAFGLDGLARFRCNASMQRGAVSLAVRVIPDTIPDIDQLGLPPVVKQLARKPRGLVLVTGPAGVGKSTTLAAMIDLINREQAVHIVTIEDPIEFLHPHQRALVDQREIGTDAPSFAEALRNVLRQDPDVIMVGELRDPESIAAALTLAETGHLTLATLHTNSAAQTIHRLIDAFPAGQQPQIRAQLGMTLEAIICQQLLPAAAGGRVLAAEVLVATPAIRTLIREDKVHQIQGVMEAGSQQGMQTMTTALARLVRAGTVRFEDAMARCLSPDDLVRQLGQAAGRRTRPAADSELG
jgi:twitching motility protein PilT